MWLTSACPGVGHHNGCAMRCPRVNMILLQQAVERLRGSGVMQPLLDSQDKTLRGGEM